MSKKKQFEREKTKRSKADKNAKSVKKGLFKKRSDNGEKPSGTSNEKKQTSREDFSSDDEEADCVCLYNLEK